MVVSITTVYSAFTLWFKTSAQWVKSQLSKTMVRVPFAWDNWISAFGFNSCCKTFYDTLTFPAPDIRPQNGRLKRVCLLICRLLKVHHCYKWILITNTRRWWQIHPAKKHILRMWLVLFKEEACNLCCSIINDMMFLLPSAVKSFALINFRICVYI